MREIYTKMGELNKKYKATIIKEGTQIVDVEKIPFSSPLANFMTYGGIPVGKITEFYGGEGGGKTTSALDICANAQDKFYEIHGQQVSTLKSKIQDLSVSTSKESIKQLKKYEEELVSIEDKGARLVVYVDTEQTLDTQWAQLLGVDTESLILVRPQEQTGEQVLQIILELIQTGDVGLVVLDSIPCLVPQQIFEESLEKKSYGGISQALTVFCSKVLPELNRHQCAFIGINQIREDLSSMYSNVSTPGGKAWKHACSLRLRFRKDSFIDSENRELSSKAESPAGNKVGIEVTKTKTCKPDRRLGFYTLNYVTGIDLVYDTITVGKIYGIIGQAGAWYRVLDDTGEIQQDSEGNDLSFQGIFNLKNYLVNNEGILDDIISRINNEITK